MAHLPTPSSTYRLQFNASFTFDAAAALVDYLAALGISHVYASSYLTAVPGSPHGYDVADPTTLNPEVGDESSYLRWIEALRDHDMGHILDIVPNHMGIARSSNPWWLDVLENGESSRFSRTFDIDWRPLKPELHGKVLLPILGDSYGAVLERQEIQLRHEQGAFFIEYQDNRLPLAPQTYNLILKHSEEAGRIDQVVERFNGVRGDSPSFDLLDELLDAQHYRLSHWRVAAEEINYRRFFDINELAAIRMDDPEVFEQVHGFMFALVERGLLDGVRVDHVDGLYDPGDYLARLQQRARNARPGVYGETHPFYVVVEKILGPGERLPNWPVQGTTGYDFLVMLNGIFIDRRNEKSMNSIYERFARLRMTFREIAYRSKQLTLRLSMPSELNVLAHRLNRFSEQNRHYRDFTLNSLADAMREIIACVPVYRTYVNERTEPGASDRAQIDFAVAEARRRNPGRPAAVFEFVRDLLLKQVDDIPEHARDEHMRFIGKFQQLTSPVTAKGIEDTALYIYNRLVSLNEVGGEPDRFGTLPDRFHAWLAERARTWPHALSPTATHDTKRSEDVRARLNVLSEIPGAWKQAISQWAKLNRRARTMVAEQSSPARNDEYLLYQTLVGSWPFDAMDAEAERQYADRIVEYMRKAMREAKVVTSWLNPSEPHERAMEAFVRAVLDPGHAAFREDFLKFQRRIAAHVIYNSLAHLAIKAGAPGVPDFYQGTELWDFRLVDPDNRQPVDYVRRRRLLQEILDATGPGAERATFLDRLMAAPSDDRLKLFATMSLVRARRADEELWRLGNYSPLAAEGAGRDHVFAFARAFEGRQALVVAPRLIATLQSDPDVPPLGERVWGDTRVQLPDASPRCYHDVFTGRCLTPEAGSLKLADVFAAFPIAVLR